MVVLTSTERLALERLEERERHLRRGGTLQRENDRTTELYVLRKGMMMSSVLLDDGSRQILRFHFAGDMIGVSSLAYREATETISALSDCVVCPFERSAFAALIGEHPRLAALIMVYNQIERAALGTRSRRVTLGAHGILTPEQARTLAVQSLAAVRAGNDPAEDRKHRREAITVRELSERFDREHISVRVKESTAKEYRRNLKRFILPALGRLRVEEVTRADVAKFHHDLRHIPYQANRNIEIISKMFSLAEMWGLRPDGSNPRRHLRKYVELKRERFLSASELRRLGEVLNEMESERIEPASAIAAVRLLVLTGCRLNEIMKLRWEHVDLPAGVLRLADSKTGAKVVHLGRAAVDALAALSRAPFNPHVIPGTLPGKPLSDLQPFWRRVRARAGLKDVRIHDLRHTYASVAVAAGQSLPMIGKLLGHTQVQTTARYAHLAGDPVQAAANDVSSAIAADFG